MYRLVNRPIKFKPTRVILVILCLSLFASAQNEEGEKALNKTGLKKITGRDERRTGIHDGNLVFTRFSNFGNLGSRFEPPKLEWPKGSGTAYGFEFIMIAGAEVVDAHGDTIHIMSENYTNPNSFDISADGTHTYGWEPLPGYFNDHSDNTNNFPAMSDKRETWPDSWPHDYPGPAGTRDGLWNGEFGAFKRADQESYYVIDDRNNDEFDYYPFIGSPTDSAGYPNGRRGLGFEVKVRGYQWVQVEAEDILIVRYDIKNVSDKDLEKVVFGMYVDPAVGGEGDSQDDMAFFDVEDDITYSWDLDGIDNKGRPGVGYFGFAFLESPGDPLNGIDDDEDGLTDERQDNDRGEFAFGPIGNFGDPKEHWAGDEDGDWRPFSDDNENGKWDDGEDIFDDVGSDGIGPFDQDYTGPDMDNTEANGMPDQGEPNFGKTDNDESDQIGLTSFLLRPAGNISNDERTWNEMTPGLFGGAPPSNLAFIYGSGYFSLPREETRKFAITCLFGNDFEDILRNKRTMQRIYDADYNFTKPPLLPNLDAVAGDHRVVLKWDKRAEKSLDPIYGKDFEGYLVYRSTDPAFNSIKTITDAFGNPIFWEPIAQFDLDDGLQGPHPTAVGVTGAHFNTGNDTGLKYFFVDENVENGRTYYYAVSSYDKGYAPDFFARGLVDTDLLAPISSSESSKIIQTDLVGNVVSIGQNCAVVVPNAPSAGYVRGNIGDGILHTGLATGNVEVDVLMPDSLKNGHTYRISFTDTTSARFTTGVTIENVTENKIVFSNIFDEFEIENQIFDGLRFEFENDSIDVIDSGWKVGESTIPVSVSLLISNRTVPLPQDFEIRVKEAAVDTSFDPLAFLRVPVNFELWSTTTNEKYDFLFVENTFKDSTLNWGDEIIVAFDISGFRYSTAWRITFGDTSQGDGSLPPQPGDIFEFHVSKQFSSDDVYEFTTKSSIIDDAQVKNDLDNIYVVPDPYVVSASWEKPLFFSSGRGERRIDFVNLPQNCTIRIFTMSGKLVKTLQHSSAISNGSESWDLVSDDGLTVSFGVYIFHVETPKSGSKIGKFALIK